MNIMIYSEHGFSPLTGGAENYAEILAQTLKMLGFNTIKACSSSPNIENDVIVIHRQTKLLYHEAFVKKFRKIVERKKIDLVHANILEHHTAYIFSKVVRSLKVPTVLTVHSWGYLCPAWLNVRLPEMLPCKTSAWLHCTKCKVSIAKTEKLETVDTMKRIAGIPLKVYSFWSLLDNSDAIISPSKEFCKALYHEYGLKAYYLPNPLPLEILRQRPQPEGDNSVLFIGRLILDKGVHLLPKISCILRDYILHVIGEGPLKNWLLRFKAYKLNIHGAKFGDEKLKFIKKSSVVIVPSICCEMFPYAITEAFACGKPIVAFDLGGPKELVKSSGGGLLARCFDVKDFAEKVLELLQEPNKAKDLGLKGRKWVEEHLNPMKYVKNLVKIYTSIGN